MTKPNRENYEIAAALITTGSWRVDLSTGEVFGKRSKPFTRTNTDGYIQIKFRDPYDWRRDRTVLAHRVVWESRRGPVKDGLELNHIDGDKLNNAIVNLEAISHRANVHHAMVTGLTPILRGVEHGKAILTDEQVRDIYARAWRGEDQDAIARDYPVTRNSVSNIKQGWSWAHITGHQRPA